MKTFLALAAAPSAEPHKSSARTASGRLAVAIPPRHHRPCRFEICLSTSWYRFPYRNQYSHPQEQRCRAMPRRPSSNGLKPSALQLHKFSARAASGRLAVAIPPRYFRPCRFVIYQSTSRSRFPYKNQYSHPQEQRCRAMHGRPSSHGLQPPA